MLRVVATGSTYEQCGLTSKSTHDMISNSKRSEIIQSSEESSFLVGISELLLLRFNLAYRFSTQYTNFGAILHIVLNTLTIYCAQCSIEDLPTGSLLLYVDRQTIKRASRNHPNKL